MDKCGRNQSYSNLITVFPWRELGKTTKKSALAISEPDTSGIQHRNVTP
jgi:hypothetical protein